MNNMPVFSSNYEAGRQAFMSACQLHGVFPDSFSNAETDYQGPLATDVAWFGPVDAERVAIFLCGTHGLEASTGAATMLHWLESGAVKSLPQGVAVMLVHAVNPYGWARQTRGNEHNIDINRNCFSRSQSKNPANAHYAKLHALLTLESPEQRHLDNAVHAFAEFVATQGADIAFQGVTGGQYDRADGLSYGGEKESWSFRALDKILDQYLGAAQIVSVLDWHTGIGAFGKPFAIITGQGPCVEQEATLAANWWGKQYVNSAGIFDGDTRPQYHGLLVDAVRAKIQNKGIECVLSTAVEFGTYDFNSVLQSLLLDQWLRLRCIKRHSEQAIIAQQKMLEMFCPSAYSWRSAVLENSVAIYSQTLQGISALKH